MFCPTNYVENGDEKFCYKEIYTKDGYYSYAWKKDISVENGSKKLLYIPAESFTPYYYYHGDMGPNKAQKATKVKTPIRKITQEK